MCLRRIAPILFVVACLPMATCAESYFELDPNSPLPMWFADRVAGQPRNRFTVTMALYVAPAQEAVLKLWDDKGHRLAKVTATSLNLLPLTLTNDPSSFCPRYELMAWMASRR
jgi:hypothetical protein